MNKKSTTIMDILKGLFVLIALAFIIVHALQFIINGILDKMIQFIQLSSKADAVIIVALITGAVSILGVVLSSIVARILEYRQSINRYLYEKREEPYSDFIEMVYRLQQKIKTEESYTEEEMVADIFKFSKKLTLWGSDNVIKKWLKFKENGQDVTKKDENLFVLEDIIFEIRNDMGQKRGKLRKGDLLSFFINDIHNYIK